MKDNTGKVIILDREIDLHSYTKGFQDGIDYESNKNRNFKHTTAMGHMEDKRVRNDCQCSNSVKRGVMKSYIGTKIVKATPMYKGFMNEGEHSRKEGYMVVYEDGYESWSPKEVFERCYREITEQKEEMMNYAKEAWERMEEGGNPNRDYIHTELVDDGHGKHEVIEIHLQTGPIKEVGENGCQAVDIIEYALNLIDTFNDAFPCKENIETMNYLSLAIEWQEQRTKDREKRKVEGMNKT